MPRSDDCWIAFACVEAHDRGWCLRLTNYQNPPNSGIFYIQLTLGKTPLGKPKRRSFPLPTCKNEQAAQERLELLAGLARRLRDAGREDLVEEMVDRAASAEGRALDEILRTAELIIGGKLAGVPKEPDPIPTIRQLGTLWTSGELHKQFPDHSVPRRRGLEAIMAA